MAPNAVGERRRLLRADFPAFLTALHERGYRVVGPTLRDGAIVLGEIRDETDLPIGWTERQDAGTYRLVRRDDAAVFGYTVGPHSWKKYLFPPRERLWSAVADGTSFRLEPDAAEPVADAFLGMRACDLAAVRISDRVFDRTAPDPGYHGRRRRTLRIAVQCGGAAPTCFCTSMGTGPGVGSDHDLALTEIVDPGPHRFLVEVGSEAGAAVLDRVPTEPAGAADVAAAEAAVARAAAEVGRHLDPAGVRELLLDHPDHPRWADVARRCFSCTNCTMACPTCFCSTTEEVPSLAGDRTEKWRRWDSCFNLEFSQVHGRPVRQSGLSRYRQWLTHKLASWHDQFGSSGCVGCGRCITWCPVGIDLTEEVRAIRADPTAVAPPEAAP